LVKDLKVDVTGVLDETNVTVDDLINLKEGDVMRLNSKITDDLGIRVEGISKFNGKLGLLGSKKAIQITSSVEDQLDASQ
jgi:flagellar motor switch protein FliM